MAVSAKPTANNGFSMDIALPGGEVFHIFSQNGLDLSITRLEGRPFDVETMRGNGRWSNTGTYTCIRLFVPPAH
jgi:hypothetical protein